MVHDVLPGLKEGLLICRPRLKDHYLLGPRDIPPEGDEASAIEQSLVAGEGDDGLEISANSEYLPGKQLV